MTSFGAGDHLVAGAAAIAAGAVNAIAGGGTLITFPALVGIGAAKVTANITNTIALCPGYFGGTYAQRADLHGEASRVRVLGVAAGLGGLTGSILLLASGEAAFTHAVPWLILLACALLAAQGWLRTLFGQRVVGQRASRTGRRAHDTRALAMPSVVTFAVSIYGGYFGAGLGIMLLAVLGVLFAEPLARLNALKQVLSLVVNVVAAIFFAVRGHVAWSLVAVMAPASLLGGALGGRLVGVIKPTVLRAGVVTYGTVLALWYLFR